MASITVSSGVPGTGTATMNGTHTSTSVRTSKLFTDSTVDKLLVSSAKSGASDALKLLTTDVASGTTLDTGSAGFALTTNSTTAATASSGGYSFASGNAAGNGTSGAYSVVTGTGSGTGASGVVSFTTGSGSTAGSASGAITKTTGTGGASATATAGGASGAVMITTGAGGANTSTGTGGASGGFVVAIGAGGAGSATGTAGAGGSITLNAGAGGSAATGGTNGAGGSIGLSAGAAVGAASAGSVSVTGGSSVNGAAGSIALTAGSSSGTGTGGSVTLVSNKNALNSMLLQNAIGTASSLRLESTVSTLDNTSSHYAIELAALAGGINIQSAASKSVTINAGGALSASGSSGVSITSSAGSTAISSSTGNTFTTTGAAADNVFTATGKNTLSSTSDFSITSTGGLGTLTSSGLMTVKSSTGNVTIQAGATGTNTINLNGNVAFNGSVTVPSNMYVGGNLTVAGTTTSVSTTNLNVADNFVVCNLNSNYQADVSNASGQGGFLMNRFPAEIVTGTPFVSGALTVTPGTAYAAGPPPTYATATITWTGISASAYTLNYFTGWIVKIGTEWAVITGSTATTPPVVTFGEFSSASWALTSSTTASLYQATVVGTTWNTAANCFSKTTALANDGAIMLASANNNPVGTSVLTGLSFSNTMCGALVCGAGVDLTAATNTSDQFGAAGSSYMSTNLLYFGKPSLTAGQWRFAAAIDATTSASSIKLERFDGTNWVTKAAWA